MICRDILFSLINEFIFDNTWFAENFCSTVMTLDWCSTWFTENFYFTWMLMISMISYWVAHNLLRICIPLDWFWIGIAHDLLRTSILLEWLMISYRVAHDLLWISVLWWVWIEAAHDLRRTPSFAWMVNCFIIPTTSTKWRRRGILVSSCLSVHPSVRPSLDRIVSALYLQQYSLDPFHIYTSFQATSEGVSPLNFFAKFLNLNFWQMF